jgi:CHAT domain-containing protein/Tfp pilus assembly protein PilF
MTGPSRFLALLLVCLPLCADTNEVQNPPEWELLQQQARNLEKAGKYPEAIRKYEESLNAAERLNNQAGVAKNLIAIGSIRIKLGDHSEALKLIQRGKELAEQLNEKLIIISALVAISEIDERQSRFQEAHQGANQALQIALELKDNQSLAAAYRSIGHCYYSQGQFKMALKNYEEALKYAEATKNPSELCRSLIAMGVAISDTGELDEGIQIMHSALEKAEEAGERPMILSILSEMGVAYKNSGMFEESAEYYDRGLRAAEEMGQKEAKARILNNLGVLNANEGRNDEAIHYYHQSLRIAEELKNRRGIALLLNNIGNIYRSEGRLEEALSYFERSLKTREEIGDQWGTASALMNIGIIFERQKQYDKAIYAYQRCLKISEQTGFKSQTAMTFRHLGETFLSLRNYQLAEESYKKAFTIGEEIHSKIITAYSLEGFGKVFIGLEKYSQAAEKFQQALSLSKEITQPEMIWRANYGLAKAYEKLEDHQQALKFYSEAIDEIEKVRARASSDDGKSGFLANHLPIYENMINFLSTLNEKYSKQNFDVQAFEYSERAKARMFLDTLTEFQSGIRKGLNLEQKRQEKQILQKISKLRSAVLDSSAELDQSEKHKKLLEAEGDLDQLILNLKLQNPQYAQLKYPEPYGISEIQKHLDEKTVLLEFFLGEKRSFVFVVMPTDIQMKTLPSRVELEESVRKHVDIIRSPARTSMGKDVTGSSQLYRKPAHALFQLLIAPVEEYLKEKEHLILILDGIFHYVPFETLIIDGDHLLIERFRISYAPSATIWTTLQRKSIQRNTKELVAFADPLLSSDTSTNLETQRVESMNNLVQLRFAREEVQGIASLYPAELREIYLSEEATEEKFQKVSQFEMIHFATHAIIDEEIPRRSGIILSSQSNQDSDGFLQMHEIWNLNLNTKLVVLSACDTGLGKLVNGEGIISVMRAFFYAGAKNVVVSLWKVDDQSTADLMRDFYAHMKSGKNPAESLRQAKLDMIREAKIGSTYAAYEEPYYWGPFILIGPGN